MGSSRDAGCSLAGLVHTTRLYQERRDSLGRFVGPYEHMDSHRILTTSTNMRGDFVPAPKLSIPHLGDLTISENIPFRFPFLYAVYLPDAAVSHSVLELSLQRSLLAFLASNEIGRTGVLVWSGAHELMGTSAGPSTLWKTLVYIQ